MKNSFSLASVRMDGIVDAGLPVIVDASPPVIVAAPIVCRNFLRVSMSFLVVWGF